MHINILAVAAYGLLSLPAGQAAVLDPRATCSSNNCLRAVIASSHTPGAASASRDCSSFFMKTVTPATVTVTATAYATSTATTTTTTVTTFQATSIDTTETTTTLTGTATTIVTSVPTIIIDTTITDTTTLTTDAATITAARKREEAPTGVRHPHQELALAALNRRQTTVSPSGIPKYASACSNAAQYSSACSCIGVTQKTTTVTAPTTTTTITSTSSSTVTSTTESSSTTTSVVVTTLVSVVSTTVTDTVVTTIPTTETVPTTTSTTILTTSTIIVCASATPSFALVATGAGVTGEYAFVPTNDGNFNDQIISFVSTITAASSFYLDSAGHLFTEGSLANIDDVAAETVFFNTPAQLMGKPVADLICTLPGPAAGMLSCVAGTNGDSIFQVCPPGGPTGGVAIGNSLQPGCQVVTFMAVPDCVVLLS